MINQNIVDLTMNIFKEGYVCDHCLGRQFSRILSGYTNKERGFSIRTFLKMSLYESGKINEIKNINILNNFNNKNNEKCWICQNIFEKIDILKKKVLHKIKDIEYSTFLIGTKLNGLLSENEELVWELYGTKYTEPLKCEINREIGKSIIRETNKNVDFLNPDLLIIINLKENEIEIKSKSLYIKGYYNKYKRGIPQTNWKCNFCNGIGCSNCNNTGNKYNNSISQMIGSVLKRESLGSDTIFHGVGREDIDVLMLGTGRPFILEIINPKKRNINLKLIEKIINNNNYNIISVSKLEYCSKENIKILKSTPLSKTYKLIIKFENNILEKLFDDSLLLLSNSIIKQRTPIRVVHRRSDIIRIKKISSINKLYFSSFEKLAIIKIKCDGGLYIKELINGDQNRTNPNLSSLIGCNCYVKELDVIDIEKL